MASKQAVWYAEGHEFYLQLFAKNIFSSLYRRSLKLSLDWAVHRYIWRGQALYIRSLFDANKNVKEPRQQRVSKDIGVACSTLNSA
jgi:hypothetical protein